jgi:hypothetical protein
VRSKVEALQQHADGGVQMWIAQVLEKVDSGR